MSASRQQWEQGARQWADVLCLWRLCGDAGCRRARCCRGGVHDCFARSFPLLPDGVRAWFVGLGAAQAEKLPFEAAMARLDATPAGEAFRAWREAAGAPLGER